MRKIITRALALALILALALSVACDRGSDTADTPDGNVAQAPDDSTVAAPSPTPSPIPAPAPQDDQTPELPFRGKIAIITNGRIGGDEEYLSGVFMVDKYGDDKIIRREWPGLYSLEGEIMIEQLEEIAADPDIRAVIINMAGINTNAAVDKLLESRPDVFVAYCYPSEYPHEVVKRAHLSMIDNNFL